MGRRRKLIRKNSAGADSVVLLIAGVITLAGAAIVAVFKIIGGLFSFGGRALSQSKAKQTIKRIDDDPDLSSAVSLLARVTNLTNFSDVEIWDKQASQLVSRLVTRSDDKSAESLADQLQEYIDLTPESKSERRELLAELRREKKEFQLQKRELNANMKNIRTEARQKSAGVPYTLTGMMGMSALQRQQLRYQKEQDLSPLENKKEWIDSKIDELERKIIWTQRFCEDAVQQTDEPENLPGANSRLS